MQRELLFAINRVTLYLRFSMLPAGVRQGLQWLWVDDSLIHRYIWVWLAGVSIGLLVVGLALLFLRQHGFEAFYIISIAFLLVWVGFFLVVISPSGHDFFSGRLAVSAAIKVMISFTSVLAGVLVFTQRAKLQRKLGNGYLYEAILGMTALVSSIAFFMFLFSVSLFMVRSLPFRP